MSGTEQVLYANVTVDISHEKLDKIFQYRVPEALRTLVHPGTAVTIPFGNGNRQIQGYVIGLTDHPDYPPEKIKEIRDVVADDTIVVSIAPGKKLIWIEGLFEKPLKIVRTMPNTPAMVGAGMTAACANALVTKEELEKVLTILRSFGEVEVVSEHLIDAVVSASGSSPAYVFMMIEAMADAAVADGMSRAQAYKFAAQSVLGSARMVLETGKHPGELKDMVCSPAGTTIEVVRVLEEKGLRSAVIEAQTACVKKAKGI